MRSRADAAEREPYRCTAKFRYRQADQQVSIRLSGDTLFIAADEPQRAVTPGQSAVLYRDDQCLGGAIVEAAQPLAAGKLIVTVG